ncbi:MAG: TolC family protein [Phycisphaeraceae bacterium]|nr:TolC family protein [Phycisphaeraceae bacterium]
MIAQRSYFFLRMRLMVLPTALLAAVGCARSNRDAGFPQVQQVVTERIGQRVHWNNGSEADRQAQERIAALLSRELSADDAVALALLNNAQLQATYEDLGVSQADLVQAGLLRNPVLSAEVRFPGRPRLPLEIDVTQSVLDLIFLPLRRAVAESEFEATRLRVTDAVLDHAARTRAAYYALQGAKQTVELRRSVVDATEAAAEAARRIHAAGNLKKFDLEAQQALAEQTQLDLTEAQVIEAENREQLERLMGRRADQPNWTIAARLPDLPAGESSEAELESLAIAQRLDLAAARQEVESLSRSEKLTRRTLPLGDVEVGGHMEREADGTTTAGPSVSVPLPIFDQGQAAIARVEALRRQSESRYSAMEVEVRSDVRRALSRMSAARRRAERLHHVVLPLRRSLTDEAQKQFNGMLIGVFQLLEIKQAEIEAGREYVRAMTDYWIARSELERAIGSQLPTVATPAPTTVPADSVTATPEPPNAPVTQPASGHHHHGGAGHD